MARVRQAALMSSASAQIALDAEGRLALSNNRASHLFGISPHDVGRPIEDLEVSSRPVELRDHIDQAMAERRPHWLRDVEFTSPAADPISFDVQFIPLSDESGGLLGISIIFSDVTQYRRLQGELQSAHGRLATAYEELRRTNEELETANEQLQSTVEELETANEELQSTVEELETTNEELQSTVEELETMSGELQSMTDELQMSNEAVRGQHQEVVRLLKLMTAALGSMRSAVAVVEADLRILAWNVHAERLWGIRADEALDRYLTDLDITLPVEQLRSSVRQVSEDGAEPARVVLDFVDRRGRALRVQVTLTRIRGHGEDDAAAMLVMDVVANGQAGVLG